MFSIFSNNYYQHDMSTQIAIQIHRESIHYEYNRINANLILGIEILCTSMQHSIHYSL